MPKPKLQAQAKSELAEVVSDVNSFVKSLYIVKVPSYGNSFFYALGFLLLTDFVVLALTGVIMVLFGPFWWETSLIGVFVRSVHMWAAEAFLLLIVLHVLTVFSTSAYRNKKVIWMIGATMFFLVLLQVAFGFGIRGDFISQWNDLSAADLWNGLYLGHWINPINWGAVYGWHIAIVPLTLVVLMGVHFLMVKKKGISRPYRSDIPYTMIYADHKKLYMRAIVLVALILIFAFVFRSPYVAPVTIKSVAQSNQSIMATTLLNEFNYSSGTATYMDSIDPYTYSTRDVYVTVPYSQYLQSHPGTDYESVFLSGNDSTQSKDIAAALQYFGNNGTLETSNSSNPLVPMISSLVLMAQSGLYDGAINGEAGSYLDTTYQLRFLSDSGMMDTIATKDGLQAQQWGVVKGTTGWWPPGLWLAAPYNWLEIGPLGNDPHVDRDGGIIAGVSFILFIFFPFIPIANEIPDKLRLYKLVWNRFTIPELKRKRKR